MALYITILNTILIIFLILKTTKKMTLDLTALESEAAKTATLEGKATTELTGATTQAQIDAVTATLKAANDALDATINPPAPTA